MMRKVLLTALLLGAFAFSSSCDAAKVDAYRDAMINKSFTLKYNITTPPVRRTNKELHFLKSDLFSTGTFYDLASNNFERRVVSGIIVVDGENKYVEKNFAPYSTIYLIRSPLGRTQGAADVWENEEVSACTLIRDDEVFNFNWNYDSDGQKRYYGNRGIFGSYSSSVKANDDKHGSRSPYEKLLDEYNYGNPALAQALTALLPPERVIDTPDTPEYKLIGSGYLSGGLTYEDFAGEKNGIHYAVRYYFNGDRLVKIAAFSYDEDSSGIKDYTKTKVDITEFSNKPDQTYLSLPESLKNKTKRKEGSK